MNIINVPVGMLGTNCYLICDEGRCVVVDPGDNGERVVKKIRESGCTPVAIFLTHGHFDHVLAVPDVLAFADVPVYIHKAEVAEKPSDFSYYPQGVKDLRHYGEGDELDFGGALRFRVMHTPGHSPGSVTLVMDGVLITGDTLFCGSCGRTDFPGGSYPEILNSLGRIRDLEGDYQVLPGHEMPSTLARERRSNYYMLAAGEHPSLPGGAS